MFVKKTKKRARAAASERSGRPVRLDLSEADYARLDRSGEAWGLYKASYARQAVLKRMKAGDAGG